MEVRALMAGDVESVLSDLRGVTHLDMPTALADAIGKSSVVHVVAGDDGPAMIFGVVEREGVACPWLVSHAGRVAAHYVTVLRQSRRVFDDLVKGYRRVVTHVDMRDRPAMRWVEHLGFKLVGGEFVNDTRLARYEVCRGA